MLAHIIGLITHYGYAGLFAALVLGIAGLPIPDETILMFCGYLVSQGRMSAPAAYATGAAGAICGISTSYCIGLSAGAALIDRWGRYLRITPAHIAHVQSWFRHRGEWVLTFGYFILGVRHLTALAAGMSRLEFRRFALFAYPGAAVWVGVFLGIGYFVGEKWTYAVAVIHRYSLAMLCFLAALALWWTWQWRRRCGKQK